MSTLREQIQQLAQNLAAETEKRRQFVAQTKQETQLLRERFAREQESVAREIALQAQSVAQRLQASTNKLQRGVKRTLEEISSSRVRTAGEQQRSRQQVVSRIQRQVASNLKRNQDDRRRSSRQQNRNAEVAMQAIRRRVTQVRNESTRLTSAISADLLAGRQALLAARRRMQQHASNARLPINAGISTVANQVAQST